MKKCQTQSKRWLGFDCDSESCSSGALESVSLVVRENQPRRDLTKVAQYEVLGNEAKGKSVP